MQALASRVASRWLRLAHANPCGRIHSYGWVDPGGKLHVMDGKEDHVQWAGKYLRSIRHTKVFDWETEITDKYPRIQDEFLDDQVNRLAFGHLIGDGWIRVTTPTVLQAQAIRPMTPAWLKVLELITEGATEGCVEAEGTVYVNEGGTDKKVPVSKLVGMLGSRRQVDDFYEALMTRMASRRRAVRVARLSRST